MIAPVPQNTSNSTSADESTAALDRMLAEAVRLYETSQYESALILARKLYSEAANHSYRKGMAESCVVQSSAHFVMGAYAPALPLAYEAIAWFEEIADSAGQAKALTVLGMVQRQLGDLAAALGTHHQQLLLCESLGDVDGQARALNGIAGLHQQQREYDRALDYCQRALHLYRSSGNQAGEAVVLTNCCELCVALGDFDAALQTGIEAWELYQHVAPNPPNQTQTLLQLARAYQGSGRFKQAEDGLLLALKISQQYQLMQHQVEILTALGGLAQAKQQSYTAIAFYQGAIDLAELHGNERLVYEAHQSLSTLYEEEGKFKDALWHFQRYHTLKEMLFNEARDQRLQQLEIRYQTEAARREATFYRVHASQLEVQRQQDRDYFERLNQLKTDMLATTTHDIKNPLASMRISLHLLRRLLPHDAQYHADSIDHQITRITALITHVLDLAKLETGRALEMRNHDLTQLMRRVLADFVVSADAKNIALGLETPDIAIALCDAARIEQVMSNLLSNAIKYTPENGTIHLRLQRVEALWQLSVQDSGLGIPPEDLPHIFEMFYRVQRSEHLAAEGTGLGLAIVKAVIEQHGGTVRVASQMGSGSTFYATLPISLLAL